MNDNEEVDQIIDYLVEMGLLIRYEDENSDEPYYIISPDCAERAPDLWEAYTTDLQKAVYRLWRADMVDIAFSEEGPNMDVIALTELAFDDNAVEQLNEVDKMYLKGIAKAITS